MITLGDAVSVLRELHRPMRSSEIHCKGLPASCVHLLYGLPDEAPVVSRADQLAERHRIDKWVST